MEPEKHITSYKTYAVVLVVLLILTAISLLVTHLGLHPWTVGIALTVTCVMAGLILIYFMHLKFDNFLIKLLVGLVFLLFVIFLVLVLLDYAYT